MIISELSMYMQIKDQVKGVFIQYFLLTLIYKNDLKLSKNTFMACFMNWRLGINLFISFIIFAQLCFFIYVTNYQSLFFIKYNEQSTRF